MPDLAPFTVCSLNLRFATAADGANAWSHRRGLLLECLSRIEPDILATQEGMPEQLALIREHFPAWEMVGEGRFAGAHSPRPSEPSPGEHCALFFRRDRFRLLETRTRWLSETPDRPASIGPGADLPRIVTRARLQPRAGGRPIDCYNTHFHWGDTFTTWAAVQLGRWIGNTPEQASVLLTGDFNVDADGPEHAALSALALRGGRRFRDIFDQHPGRQGTHHGFTGETDVCIDWIFTSSDLGVSAAWTDTWSQQGRYPSDHFPVVATLRPATTETAR